MLNISNSDIKKSDIITDGDTIYYDITLVRKPMTWPYCGGKMNGHGHKLRLIKYPAIRNHSGIIRCNTTRYICKECNKPAIEKNPFSFPGFNSSFLLLQNAMRLLANLNYTLSLISDELDISSKYIYWFIHHNPCPHSPWMPWNWRTAFKGTVPPQFRLSVHTCW